MNSRAISREEQEKLTADNYARLCGKEEMTENLLRTSQNRYLMHRNYCKGSFDGEEVVIDDGKRERGREEEDEWKEM